VASAPTAVTAEDTITAKPRRVAAAKTKPAAPRAAAVKKPATRKTASTPRRGAR